MMDDKMREQYERGLRKHAQAKEDATELQQLRNEVPLLRAKIRDLVYGRDGDRDIFETLEWLSIVAIADNPDALAASERRYADCDYEHSGGYCSKCGWFPPAADEGGECACGGWEHERDGFMARWHTPGCPNARGE